MKSPSDDAQNTSGNAFTNRTTLRDSILQDASSNSNVVGTTSGVFPTRSTMTSTNTANTSSPESEAVRRERLRVILNFALAVIDSDDFDLIDSFTTHKRSQE